MVYSNMIITCMKWLLFLLLPVVKCHHAGGEKTASFPVFFFFEKKKQWDERGNPMWWTVEIYSLPLYTSSLKTGFVSLYVFEVLVQV